MYEQLCSFEELAADVAAADAFREKVRRQAFDVLERHASTIATMALQLLGNRDRAAHWMCSRQRRLGGRSPYEALADGDVDCVWDLMAGIDQDE
ncbi:antitoxin Xre/MbcA/ParS toxin-binding domain-containing protein [Dyella choica]|uniref:DUF2384 domain-containing protein n=1 Tax=Dyella choica TaxID=1927959 RepID=A0A3S0PKP1_9GAMM|nr:antitoxin Xre/MbcA/ParS toxin-binding domain-containing protein [Dyella choica]RUL78831.1 DUF2384 domain-containing protein [Dyella choica]